METPPPPFTEGTRLHMVFRAYGDDSCVGNPDGDKDTEAIDTLNFLDLPLRTVLAARRSESDEEQYSSDVRLLC